MQRSSLIIISTLALMAGVAGRAEAAGFGDYLAYCAGGSTDVDNTVKDSALSGCGVTKGTIAACGVVSGSPWVCATGTSATGTDQQCDYHQLKFEITATISMPGGWSVGGSAKATYTRWATRKNVHNCTAAPVVPPPIGSGGEYSSESGDMDVTVKFVIEGNITVKTPAGITVELNASAGCQRSTNTSFYRSASINSCSPSPSPTSTSTTSPTSSSTASPTGSPNTSPTATATSSASPTATATSSASPTATATSSASPTATATGSPQYPTATATATATSSASPGSSPGS